MTTCAGSRTFSLGLQSYLRFEGGTGVGLEGPVIPSEEVRLEP